MVYVKKNIYYVDGTVYGDDGSKEYFDESLYTLIFGYTTSLLLLMSYIAEGATGKSLKEQIHTEESEKEGQSPINIIN